MSAYDDLKAHFQQRAHLLQVEAITSWDEAVTMPEGSGDYRAKASATLRACIHDMEAQTKLSDLLAKAKTEIKSSAWDSANLAWMEKIHRDALAIPRDLVSAYKETTLRCEQAWRTLRAENNWKAFSPLLKQVLDLSRERAQIRGETFKLSPYDALLDEFSPGFTQSVIDPIFQQLTTTLPTLCQQVQEKQSRVPHTPITGDFPISLQKELGISVMKAIGFDFNLGRLDVSHHPFCGGTARDVRITTRYNTKEFVTSLMGVCHESGHGMYELGLPEAWLDQPVGSALGMALHESQSLLVEMQACRSLEFMKYLAPLAAKTFPGSSHITPENLYKIYTHVSKGLIRVDADEVTYPLHVILRYELEKQLINKTLSVDDLPEAWNHYMMTFFGLSTKKDYTNGVMQDVHWPAGCFGYFPAYTLGALIAAQLFQTALKAFPSIPQELSQGNFKSLMMWLRGNVHSKASLLNYDALLREATNSSLDAQYFLNHLHHRYLS